MPGAQEGTISTFRKVTAICGSWHHQTSSSPHWTIPITDSSNITSNKHRNVSFTSRLLTYLLTTLCRVLLEKLTGLQLVKKFPAIHGTRRFITALTRSATCLYPRPAQSSPYTHIPHPGDPSSLLSEIVRRNTAVSNDVFIWAYIISCCNLT